MIEPRRPPLPAPLTGALVLDLSRAPAGPHAAMMLGDLGARVIKAEYLRRRHPRMGPPFIRPDQTPRHVLPVLQPQQGVIVLDLKSDGGAASAQAYWTRLGFNMDRYSS